MNVVVAGDGNNPCIPTGPLRIIRVCRIGPAIDTKSPGDLGCWQFFGSQKQSDKRKSVKFGRGRAAVTGNESPRPLWKR